VLKTVELMAALEPVRFTSTYTGFALEVGVATNSHCPVCIVALGEGVGPGEEGLGEELLDVPALPQPAKDKTSNSATRMPTATLILIFVTPFWTQ
jgi:hypothetical protein